jgi:receptor tyrosine kinase
MGSVVYLRTRAVNCVLFLSSDHTSIVITVVVIVVLAIIIVVIVIVVAQVLVVKRRQRRLNSTGGSTASSRQRYRATAVQQTDTYDIVIDVDQLPMNDAYDDATTTTRLTLEPQSPKLSRLECDRNAIAYYEDLPSGAFGSVFVATLTGSNGLVNGLRSGTRVVVKTLCANAESAARRDFIRAGELVAGLDHPNIIRVVGACLRSEPICLVFEYMPGGELGDFLHENGPRHHIYRNDETRSRVLAEHIGIARQIADAMVYFAGCGFVHRDLAARNCLVGEAPTPPGPRIVKLADFGLAVELNGREFHRGADDEEIPVRWMPPEAIVESRFAPASDVWSFAVLVWEVFSFGAKPYDGLSSQEAARRIVNGKVLERPDLAPPAVYDLMRLCWNADAAKRPNFEKIRQRLVDLERKICERILVS